MRITAEDENQATQASAKCIVDSVTPGNVTYATAATMSFLTACRCAAYYLDAMTDLIG